MKKILLTIVLVIFLSLFLDPATAESTEITWPPEEVVISDPEVFIEGINKAQHTLFLGAYKLQDHLLPNPGIMEALKNAAKRGVKVTLMIEKNLTTQEKAGDPEAIKKGDALNIYQNLNVKLVECPSHFKTCHMKVLLADDQYAFIGTTNFDADFRKRQGLTRDFSIFVTDPGILDELKEVFTADVENKKIYLPPYQAKEITGTHRLSWGPDQHREHFLELIDSAKKTIDIYQQDLQDAQIVEHLTCASHRGVSVRVLMSNYPFGENHGNKNEVFQQKIKDAQGQVKLTQRPNLHIHAKVLIVDGKEKDGMMYMGSCNFFSSAIDKDRQVGLITNDLKHVQLILDVFEKDWQETS